MWLQLTKNKKAMQNLRILKSKTHKTMVLVKTGKDQTPIMILSLMHLKFQVIMTMLKTIENTLATCTREKILLNFNLKL